MSQRHQEDILPRWYFGGVASAAAVCITHPLDLIKVQLQTKTVHKVGAMKLTSDLFKRRGIMVFYSGLSASIVRQLTYSTIRFGIYDTAKIMMGNDTSMLAKCFVAMIAGGIGGWVGAPPDKINVRMQNDSKLEKGHRYDYKHVFDGLHKVYTKEGKTKLFSGASSSTTRGMIMSVGQIAFYDEIKTTILEYDLMEDNVGLHFTASLFAGGIATLISQPLDVIKTKTMSAPPGEYNCSHDVINYILSKYGPLGFFRGLIPGFMRIGPQTILTFIFYEQLRIHGGYYPPTESR